MKNKNNSGFSIVETVLVLVIVGMIGFIGWFVYHTRQTTNKNYSAASADSTPSSSKNKTSAADPYTGWKAGSLKYEQISYKYPSDWTVDDESKASDLDSGCVTPGYDAVTLTSPSDHQISIRTGIDCIGDGGAQAYDSVSLKTLGQDDFLVIENNPQALDPNATGPSFACLSKTSTADNGIFLGDSQNIKGGGSAPLNRFCYYPYNFTKQQAADQAAPIVSASTMKAAPDFNTAVLIFESMKYTSS